MPDVILPHTGQTEVAVGGSTNTWGDKVNANFAIVDALFSSGSGHDHSGAGKGKPIPSGGLKALSTASQGLVAAKGDGDLMLASAGNGIVISSANVIAVTIHTLTAKTALADADEFLVADSAASWVGKRVARSNLLAGASLAGTPYAHDTKGSVSGTVTCDVSLYGSFSITLTGNTTLALSNAVAGKLYVVTVEITNGGAYTFTQPTGAKHPGGLAPTLTASGVDVLYYSTRDGGTTWRCTSQIDSR